MSKDAERIAQVKWIHRVLWVTAGPVRNYTDHSLAPPTDGDRAFFKFCHEALERNAVKWLRVLAEPGHNQESTASSGGVNG